MPLDKKASIDILDRYLQGLCTDQEIQSVESRLSSDQEFKATYEQLLSLSEGARLDNLNAKMHLLKDYESALGHSTSDETIQPSGGKVVKMRWLRSAVAACAAIVLSVFAWQLIGDNEESRMSMAEFQNYIVHDIERSNEKQLSDLQQVAYNNYVIQDFDDAIPKLKQLWEDEHDTIAYYYLGICYWCQGEETEAHEILDQEQFEEFKKPF